MTERKVLFLLIIWSLAGCSLLVLAPLTYIYVWPSKPLYALTGLLGLLLVTLRVSFAFGLRLAVRDQSISNFAKVNTKHAIVTFVVSVIIVLLELMFIHI